MGKENSKYTLKGKGVKMLLTFLDVPCPVFCNPWIVSLIVMKGNIENISKEEFEDNKGVIRIRISKKNRQYNGQMKTHKRTNNDLQNIHIKLKIE
jgi:hypothetical protein